MKRKICAVLTLTAMLSAGAAVSAWAAAGWVQNNGQWQYQDRDGYIVRNEWQKGADGKYRYLDSSGYIAVSTWIDDEYYVGSDGIMVTDSWLREDCSSETDSGIAWYYFDSRGQAVKEGWKKIDDVWYYFDDVGVMQTGWVDENRYYTNENGQMLTGWQLLDPPEDVSYDEDDEEEYDPFTQADNDGKYWYYFKSNGRKVTPDEDSGNEYGTVRIDGDYYCMNSDGALQYGWKNVEGGSSITSYKYFKSDGKMVTGWYSLAAPRGIDDSSDEIHWYYFNSKGVPKADEDGIPTKDDLLTINGKTYLFNNVGNPVYGLRKVYLGESEDESNYTSYYFGEDDNDCWAHSGKIKVEEDSGEENTYYFTSAGRGFTGIKDNYLYYVGKLQVAQNDKYELINVPGKDYAVMVNSSGKVMKSTTVKNSDDIKYKTNSSGQVIEIDGEEVSGVTGIDPEEPNYVTDDWYSN
ncbi:MAG TPA: cell wall-binding protein [Candidatus Caccovicinus merdipullorum]|uniref:Cell wall-binding protein n=1 Tax=Candidatus Caccovicinus merdipullorum TaxID=2840724 RepID=A0A9D1GGC1_9FIRM|nr:cell wall-binding protein [Candidatus Caccovicinus merdipullorum]